MIQEIPINYIENNTGQLKGLPPNPRSTDPAKLDKLIKSIQQDPEMLELRGLLVYPIEENKYITIGGNMRLRALNKLGFETVPCIVIPKDTPISKLKNYIIKDNGDFGDWDFHALSESWDLEDLEDWAIDMPEFNLKDIDISFDEKKRAAWRTREGYSESLCDLKEKIVWHKKKDFSFISFFKKSEEGYPLSEIKQDPANIHIFSEGALNVIKRVIQLNIPEGWALITTPKRRHKETNFAEMVCLDLSEKLKIPFYKEAITAKNKQRINPVFFLETDIKENNLIIFDDIISTGSTILAVNELLSDKNCFYVIGIDNHL